MPRRIICDSCGKEKMCGKEKYAIGDISYVPHVLIVVAYVHCVEHA